MLSRVIEILSSTRFSLNNEKELQNEIWALLIGMGLDIEREYKLDDHNTVDFFINNEIAVEVKIKGSAKAIYRQCERYCEIEEVKHFILLTNRAMGFPKEIKGKPCYLVSLGKSWL